MVSHHMGIAKLTKGGRQRDFFHSPSLASWHSPSEKRKKSSEKGNWPWVR